MGMNHKFLLVEKTKINRGYDEYAGIKRYYLHDDFISFVMLSSLEWIPIRNPSTNAEGFGLNLYGPTLIEKRGIDVAKKIFAAWRDLISAAPDTVYFHCGHEYVDGEQRPFKPEFKKSELLENLNGIVSLLENVGDDFSLLHLGI
jgi:hypothetical protein